MNPPQALLVLVIATAQQALAGQPRITLPVAVYNYADVSDAELARMREAASGVLEQAGIEPEWVTAGSTQRTAVIKLLTPEMGGRLGVRASDMGLAAIDPRTGFGWEAYILTDRVRREASAQDVDFAFLLGVSIVHELGHLFLGAGHEPFGIMKPRLLRTDLSRAARGELGFDAGQRRRIHARLAIQVPENSTRR